MDHIVRAIPPTPIFENEPRLMKSPDGSMKTRVWCYLESLSLRPHGLERHHTNVLAAWES